MGTGGMALRDGPDSQGVICARRESGFFAAEQCSDRDTERICTTPTSESHKEVAERRQISGKSKIPDRTWQFAVMGHNAAPTRTPPAAIGIEKGIIRYSLSHA